MGSGEIRVWLGERRSCAMKAPGGARSSAIVIQELDIKLQRNYYVVLSLGLAGIVLMSFEARSPCMSPLAGGHSSSNACVDIGRMHACAPRPASPTPSARPSGLAPLHRSGVCWLPQCIASRPQHHAHLNERRLSLMSNSMHLSTSTQDALLQHAARVTSLSSSQP